MVKCKAGDIALIKAPGMMQDGWPVVVIRPAKPEETKDNPINLWVCQSLSREELEFPDPKGGVAKRKNFSVYDSQLLPMRDTPGTDEMQCITGPALEFELRRLNSHLDKLRDALLKLKDNLSGDEK